MDGIISMVVILGVFAVRLFAVALVKNHCLARKKIMIPLSSLHRHPPFFPCHLGF